MKHWPSQLFPIVVLALLAGLTFWLQKIVDRDALHSNGKLRHDPDAMAENFTLRHFDHEGRVKYRLIGPYMTHYADDDTSELKLPVLHAYRPGAPDITISSRQAKVTSKGETVYMWDDVVLTRAGEAGRPEMVARMPYLTARPNAGLAFTSSPVEITQGASWIKGIGMEIDNNTSTLVLQSQVRGTYIRSRAQP